MLTRCRQFDWASTPLGPLEQWPQSLRTTARIVLDCRNPMFLWWGPELVQIYNDAYRPSLGEGGRHPGALGMRARDFWTDIWEAIGPQIDQVMSGGGSTWHEDQYLPIERNGRLEDVWWTYSYSPVYGDDGGIAGTLVVCLETTQRIRTEQDLKIERERLAYVFRQAPTFLAVLRGPDHVFELANEAYMQLVGKRDLIGRPAFEALPELEGSQFRNLLDAVLRTGEPFMGREVPVTLVRTAGAPPEERFLDFNYMPLIEGDGTRSGVIAHGTDMTAQVMARRDIERLLRDSELARAEAEAARGDADLARTEAESANRAKSDFLAIMSHELRTPLNAIGGYAELLEMGIRGPVTAAQQEDLRRIQSSQRHLLGLINEVLNYAKLETGTVHYDLADIRVHEAVAGAESLVAPQARAKQLTLTVTGGDRELSVRADAEKLRQILVNVLSNAVKFTDPGGAITLSWEAAGEAVHIHVRDTGIGISRDKLEDVFEPFVQVRAEFTRTAEGTGLGLAISRDLARGMGGDLTAESEPGVGSTFTLALPRA